MKKFPYKLDEKALYYPMYLGLGVVLISGFLALISYKPILWSICLISATIYIWYIYTSKDGYFAFNTSGTQMVVVDNQQEVEASYIINHYSFTWHYFHISNLTRGALANN